MSSTKRKRVIVAGLRSVPGVEGGVEAVVQNLYPAMAGSEWDVTVVVRKRFYDPELNGHWRGLTLVPMWAPNLSGFEALLHTFLATLYAIVKRPDVLHLHAIGPALFTPLARLFGLRVVVTHHGPDYDREKWGIIGKAVLRLGEYVGMRFANERIVISKTIDRLVTGKYDVVNNVIPNGVKAPSAVGSSAVVYQHGLKPKHYFVQVSRFVPEKRQIDLIRAYHQALPEGWKLVFVGRDEDSIDYANQAKAAANGDPNIVFTGFQTGEDLNALLANAGAFVLPSSHEGLPVALLEALSFGLRTIVSAIPANLEVGLEDEHYYPMGDVEALSQKLVEIAADEHSETAAKARRAQTLATYNWHDIAQRTMAVYDSETTPADRRIPVRATK